MARQTEAHSRKPNSSAGPPACAALTRAALHPATALRSWPIASAILRSVRCHLLQLPSSSHINTDHKAFAGCGGPFFKMQDVLFAPFSGRPSASTKANGYTASSGAIGAEPAASKVGVTVSDAVAALFLLI